MKLSKPDDIEAEADEDAANDEVMIEHPAGERGETISVEEAIADLWNQMYAEINTQGGRIEELEKRIEELEEGA